MVLGMVRQLLVSSFSLNAKDLTCPLKALMDQWSAETGPNQETVGLILNLPTRLLIEDEKADTGTALPRLSCGCSKWSKLSHGPGLQLCLAAGSSK